jgi:Reverse transcriptase (RNA-dependent DNA polymerase)
MLKQSFTAENFRKIFDYENRKGVNLEGEFFPKVNEISEELRGCSPKLRALRNKKSELTEEEYENEKRKLREIKNALKQNREIAITQELENISSQVTDKTFQIKLNLVSLDSGKTAYSIEHNAASYFAVKQIQYNFQKLYKVKQSNRYDIVRQLTKILDNNFPKYLIRTDIHSFYESIPTDKILAKINNDHLLTHISKKIIRGILKEYNRLSGSTVGIPRGVGVSAYLSELHMRDFDKAIMNHPELAYYARYVDDIVVVFYPNAESNTSDYLSFIRSEVRNEEIGLELNDGENSRDNKTELIDLSAPSEKKLEYLGYQFVFGAPGCKPKLHLSDKKIARYKKRIDLAFVQHATHTKTDKNAADKILVKRLLFLSGNTRLVGNKKNALVGIYYSNSLLAEDSDSLVKLDNYLRSKVNAINECWLKRRLKKISFKDGFMQRSFARFSTKQLAEIVRVWKHET